MTRGRSTAVEGPDVSVMAGEGRQRVGVLCEVPRVLEMLGADPEAVFATAGLHVHVLEKPDNEISFAAMGRLLRAAVDATGC